ncbi:MAG: hypothetical protein F7B95_02440 [Desulfurococcales archaeon]|nr:hypothetical protein [Desulfurococcales archaeon]
MSKTWRPLPVINMVYETIVEATNNGEKPVLDEEIRVLVENKYRIKLSDYDLADILVKLEILGWISTSSTAKEGLIIKLKRKAD